MEKSGIAKIFRNGRSQAVRLPREFRFEGDAVRVRRVPEGVLLEPLIQNTEAWFSELDQVGVEELMKSGRKQPITPKRRIFV
jgi:antitoxin VapB